MNDNETPDTPPVARLDGTTFEERFAGLEQASRQLSTDVLALTATLQIVADLQIAQREQSERQASTERKIAQAKSISEARDARTKSVVRFVAVGFGVLIPTMTVLVYASVIAHVNDLLVQQRKTSYANCTLRNNASKENVLREQQLAVLEDRPAIRTLHANSAKELAKSIVDCSYLKAKR